jgi:hypothetical protein
MQTRIRDFAHKKHKAYFTLLHKAYFRTIFKHGEFRLTH